MVQYHMEVYGQEGTKLNTQQTDYCMGTRGTTIEYMSCACY
jgi:hypothetical protein